MDFLCVRLSSGEGVGEVSSFVLVVKRHTVAILSTSYDDHYNDRRGTSDVLGVNNTVSYLPAIPLPLFQRVLQKFPVLPRDLREGRSRNDRFYPQIRWPRARLRPCISLPIRRLGELGVSLRFPRVEVVDKCRCSLPLLRGQQGWANAG